MIAAVVVGGVAVRGGAGTVLGVALGALTLLVIRNGLTLVRVDPLWLQGVYGLVILVAIGVDAFVARPLRIRMRSATMNDRAYRLRVRRELGDASSAVLTLALLAYAGLAVPTLHQRLQHLAGRSPGCRSAR